MTSTTKYVAPPAFGSCFSSDTSSPVIENGGSPKPVPQPKLSPKIVSAEADYFPINMASAPSTSPTPKEEKLVHNERKRRASTDSAEVRTSEPFRPHQAKICLRGFTPLHHANKSV